MRQEDMMKFERYLKEDERSIETIRKYVRDLKQFSDWLGDRDLAKEEVQEWKEELMRKGYRPVSINGKIASLNKFFVMMDRQDLRIKPLKIQRRVFRDEGRELTKKEYERLLYEAKRQGKERLELLMETICATGIRVSEVQYITAEAIGVGRAEICLKGKIRSILIPGKLCRKLSKYAKKQGIKRGEIFITKHGTPLSRKQIWMEMKRICKEAGVEATKVFPHNLRHLFARCFYKASHDLVRLADVLGHSSVETTRIYLISTGAEHARTLNQLSLIL